MENLSKEVIDYVTEYWKTYHKLTVQVSKNDATNNSVSYKLETLLQNELYDIKYSNAELSDQLYGIILRCTDMLQKIDGADNNRVYRQISQMEEQYAEFMEKHGIDLDDRSIDEDLYSFIHGM